MATKFRMDPGWEADYTRRLNEAVNGAIGEVNESHGGEPVDVVHAALRARIDEATEGSLKLEDSFTLPIAEKISSQTLE